MCRGTRGFLGLLRVAVSSAEGAASTCSVLRPAGEWVTSLLAEGVLSRDVELVSVRDEDRLEEREEGRLG